MKPTQSPTRLAAFKYAFQGIAYLIRSQTNAKIHLSITIVVIVCGFYFNLEKSEWLWLNFAISIVWISETINTAIEELTNLVSPDFHILAKRAKDLGAAATLLAAIFAAITGMMIFFPKILSYTLLCVSKI
ncbi:MAG: diacylglycerol kinase family protein [Bacteroidia bacterium]|nr:diacylglycerol kinase family protein [Bacteroidia bacterium]